MGPFEVSKESISALSDTRLRLLLKRLLEAEAKQAGIPSSAISVGGDQAAADGGVDASIIWKGGPAPRGWLPRRTTYFQCKAQVIAAAELGREMRPYGRPRPAFDELASAEGAYIIFSTDDVSHAGYTRRMTAMAEALADVGGREQIHLDFFGADRIARWTNQHPGVAIWLLEQTGRGLGGWRPIGQWSAPDSGRLPYLFDGNRRATVGNRLMDIRSAIIEIRKILSKPGGTVRLVGLSGMGKTRLAEVLFDDRLDAPSALAPSRAVYGDIGLELAVGPALLTEQLVMAEVEATIIADNCAARTHGQLAEIVTRTSSRVSLLTIDYDVGGDKPVGDLVVLDSNSEAVISSLLDQRRPGLTAAERHHLSRFSGGNARIALKIAEGADEGVDLSTLRDSELLERLFRSNRQEREAGLRRSAELASLVYAFYVEAADGHVAEHPILAGIGNVAIDDFYRQVATLLDWGVVQQRGPQRAVMPPPLANMLAAPFIRRSDPEALLQKFLDGPPRLLASFAKRLGELHAEPAAERIVRGLFASGGRFGDLRKLNPLSTRGFLGAAPAAPDAALATIERTIARTARSEIGKIPVKLPAAFATLLEQIAFEDRYFGRAMEAIIDLGLVGSKPEAEEIRRSFADRFRPYGSGTRASQATRVATIDRMLDDARPGVRELAVKSLGRMLDVSDRAGLANIFGNRSRLDEWQPQGDAGHLDWCAAAFDRLGKIAAGDDSLRTRARSMICESVPQHAGRSSGPVAVAALRSVATGGYSHDTWHAAILALGYHEVLKPDEGRSDLQALERDLRPRTVEQWFDSFVIRNDYWPTFRNFRFRRFGRSRRMAKTIGWHVSRSNATVRPLMELCGKAEVRNDIREFGIAIGRNTKNRDRIWADACEAFVASSRTTGQLQMLVGILAGVAGADKAWVSARLDEAVDHPVLSEFLIALQTSLGFDERAVDRITASLARGSLRAEHFSELLGKHGINLIPESALHQFLRLLFNDERGRLHSIFILYEYLLSRPRADSPRMMELARAILSDPRTYAEDTGGVQGLSTSLARILFALGPDPDTPIAICEALRRARPSSSYVSPSFQRLGDLLRGRFPTIVLDEILGKAERDDIVRIFFGEGRFVADDTALHWMRAAPARRALQLARVVPVEPVGIRAESPGWSAISLRLLETASNPIAILRTFERRFFSGPGSLTWRLMRFRHLVAALAEHSDPRIRTWQRSALERVGKHIARCERRERSQNSRFE